MAKELPYFKFEPNQWDNGTIQMFTHEEKGVFMDLCSMYWSRLGDLPYKLAVGKICNGNALALDSLYDEKVFDIIDGNIFIKFLSEQLNEFENTSIQNSKNAKEGWENRRKQKELQKNNASALRTQSKPNAIREDKRKGNKIREDNLKEKKEVFNFRKSLIDLGFDEVLVMDWLKVRKTKKASNTQTAFNTIKNEVEKTDLNINDVLKTHIVKSWSGFKVDWYKNENQKEKNVTPKNVKINAGTLIKQKYGLNT